MKRRLTGLLVCVVLLLPVIFPTAGQAAPQPADAGSSGVNVSTLLADGLILDVTTPTYAVENLVSNGDTYQRLVVDGAEQRQERGQAQLPFYSVVLGLPAGAEVQVEVLDQQSARLDASLRLPLGEQPAGSAGELAPGTMVVPGAALTTGGALNPAQTPAAVEQFDGGSQPVRVGETAWLRSQRIVRLEVYPFGLDGPDGGLTWRQHLQVRVKFVAPGGLEPTAQAADAQDAAFESVYRSSLLNYEQARAWRSSLAAGEAAAADLKTPFTGTRYRIDIEKDGLYRLSYEMLKAEGLAVDALNPANLHLSNQGDEVAILVENKDGNPQKFSPGEGIVFFGQRFYGDRMAERFSAEDEHWLSFTVQNTAGSYYQWTPQMTAWAMERYTSTNVYWLYADNTAGLRMLARDGAPDGVTSSQAAFRSVIRSEPQNLWKTNPPNGEDVFYWLMMNTSDSTPQTNTTVSVDLPDVAPTGDSALVRSAFSATVNGPGGTPDHQIRLYVNDPGKTMEVGAYQWDGISRFEGQSSIAQNRLVSGPNRVDLTQYDTVSISGDGVYLNWIEFEYDRLFNAVENQLLFTKSAGGGQKFQVSGLGGGERLALDVSNPLQPVQITGGVSSSDQLTFQDSSTGAGQRIAGAVWEVGGAAISPYTAPDFSAGGEYVIITHSSLMAAAQELAGYRQGRGLSVRLVDIADLFNLFTDGIYHPLAIKEFLRYADQAWSTQPVYVTIIGDGHWNFHKSPNYGAKDILIPPYLNWVDPWMGEVDSANLLANIRGSDPLPDVHIARMPVNTPAELHSIVAKIQAYEAAPLANWQRNNIFLAENTPDSAGDFVAYSEAIIDDYVAGRQNALRFYLDDYTDTGNCGPNSGSSKCSNATTGFIDLLNTQGGALLNYVGHAGMNFWTSEVIFSNENIAALANGDRLPVLLSLTCMDGYWIHPSESSDIGSRTGPSLSETLLRAEQRGTVASFSPTGLGLSTGHDALQRGFYDLLYQQNEWGLGQAALSAKVRLYGVGWYYDLLHTFTVFGDPALEIAHIDSLFLPVAVR